MRKVLLLVSAVAMLAGMLMAGGASASGFPAAVGESEALAAAMQCQSALSGKYPAWDKAQLDPTVVYRGADGRNTAYEFALNSDTGFVGFMLISATKDWMPLLECGTGAPPSARVVDARDICATEGYITASSVAQPVLLYWGGLSYSVQFGEKMTSDRVAVHLPTGTLVEVPPEQPALQMDATASRVAWDALESGPGGNAVLSSGYVYGVPAWYQTSYPDPNCDPGGGFTMWPYCEGMIQDSWGNWDGCSTIAGAMIHGFWGTHGYPGLYPGPPTWTDEILIDDNHHFMGTNNDGITMPWNILDGVKNTFGYYGYGYFIVEDDYFVSWDDIKNQVNAQRPSILSMTGSPWGSHSVTVVGYDEPGWGNLIILHNTYDTSDQLLTYGNWATAMLTTARPY